MAEPGVAIEEREGLAMIQISAWAPTAEAAGMLVVRSVGLRPPVEPNTVAASGQTRILWLGPHRWLIAMPREPARDLHAELAALLPADVATAVDLGAGRRVFAVSGARARDVLSKDLPIDLHPARFPPGRCVQSSMAHVGVLVHAQGQDRFEIFVYRAFAQHFREMLTDAAMEFTAAA